jgi:hypothetical protein
VVGFDAPEHFRDMQVLPFVRSTSQFGQKSTFALARLQLASGQFQLGAVQLRSSVVCSVQKRELSIVVGLEAFCHFGESCRRVVKPSR